MSTSRYVRRSAVRLVAALVAVVLGCRQRSEELPSATPSVSPATAGAAFVQNTSIQKIDEHGAASIVVDHVDQPIHMTTDRDGRLWVAAAGVLTCYGDGAARSVKLPGDSNNTLALARAAGGGVWALQHHAVVRISDAMEVTSYSAPRYEEGGQMRDGKFVDSVPVGLIGKPLDFFLGAFLELDDDVWVACPDGLYRFSLARKAWDRVRLGFFTTLVRDSNGMLWTVDNPPARPLGHYEYLVGWNGASSFEVVLPEGAMALAAGRDGRVFTLTAVSVENYDARAMVHVFTANRFGQVTWGPSWMDERMSFGGPFVVDSNERIWTRSHNVDDVLVFDRAGQLLATLPYGMAYEIAVARGGPSLDAVARH